MLHSHCCSSLGNFGGTSIGTDIQSISAGRANDVLVTVDLAIANRTRSTEDTMLSAQHVDTVQEVQVLTTNYSAEYGRASSGIVGLVTKGGTRDFPGTARSSSRTTRSTPIRGYAMNATQLRFLLATEHDRAGQEHTN